MRDTEKMADFVHEDGSIVNRRVEAIKDDILATMNHAGRRI